MDTTLEDEYKKIIQQCADAGKNFEIENSNPAHASYLITTLFGKAESEMRIFTGRLFDNVYGNEDLKEAAIKFLNKSKAILKIAYQEALSFDEVKEGNFLKDILTNPTVKGKVEIYNASTSCKNLENHFIVKDKAAFRYELDKTKMTAKANFGDFNIAKKLVAIFDLITNNSEKVYPVN